MNWNRFGRKEALAKFEVLFGPFAWREPLKLGKETIKLSLCLTN
jgi:hypothetical protein